MRAKLCPMCKHYSYSSFYFYRAEAICPECYMKLSIEYLKGENK